MPRVRADDYDIKTQAILDSAAALFAKVGYPNAKMQDIAKACGATKSMLYHYFPTKDDLLFAMLNWTDNWYKPGGQIKPQELCDRITRLFLRGFLAEKV